MPNNILSFWVPRIGNEVLAPNGRGIIKMRQLSGKFLIQYSDRSCEAWLPRQLRPTKQLSSRKTLP